jgi:hypothetical protein
MLPRFLFSRQAAKSPSQDNLTISQDLKLFLRIYAALFGFAEAFLTFASSRLGERSFFAAALHPGCKR